MNKILNGISFVITGKTTTKRADFKNVIEANGGVFMTSVKPETAYLIIADLNSQAIKHCNAREMGIKLISEQQFFEMIA